ncbi:unnamed protein product, partial [Darwinula stevensoni]
TYIANSQVGDSGACATALFCGVKGNFETVGLDPSGRYQDCSTARSAHVPCLFDWAHAEGKSRMDAIALSVLPWRMTVRSLAGKWTGIVTNTRITHATPAGLYAHSPSRYWEDDVRLSEQVLSGDLHGSPCKDIARQLVEDSPGKHIRVRGTARPRFQVVFGGGRRHLMPLGTKDPGDEREEGRRRDGRNLILDWVEQQRKAGRNGSYIWNGQQLRDLDPFKTDAVLGLFGHSHLSFEMDRNPEEPSLVEMTRKAVQILRRSPKGFLLVVEGSFRFRVRYREVKRSRLIFDDDERAAGRMDHAHHFNNAARALDEVLSLEASVEAAMELVDTSRTIVVVGGDHSHSLTLGGQAPRGNPILGL